MSNYQFTNIANDTDILRYLEPKPKAIRMNIPDLDDALGGLRLGKIYLISAPTGWGKTTAMLSIMMNAAITNPDKKFLYIATEQDLDEIEAKMIANLTGISSYDIETHNLTEEKHKDLLLEVNKKLSNIYFVHYGDHNFKVKECIEAAADAGIEYVFYDYLGALSDLDDAQEWRTLEQETDDIKRIAQDKNIFIMMASQCNRNIKEMTEKPKFLDENNLARSRGIANKLDIGMILWKGQKIGDKEGLREITMYIYKNRSMAESDPLDLRLDYSCCKMTI